MESGARLVNQLISGRCEHDREIIRHDVGVSSGGADGSGVSLQPLSWVHPSFIGLDSGDFETTGPLERSECLGERRGPFWAVGADIGSIAGDVSSRAESGLPYSCSYS